MPASYFVFYEGGSADREGFLRHYRDVHAPILGEFPGITEVRLHTPMDWHDSQPVQRRRFVLIAEMVFPDLATLEAALASEPRQRARADMLANFPAFSGTVVHQATAWETKP